MRNFTQSVVPPFSFTYDGKHSSQLLPRWKFEHQQKQLDNARALHTFTWLDPETKLEVRCECTLFADFPAVEWVLKFKFLEGAGEKSPLLEDVKALDLKFVSKTVNGFVLHRSLGSNAQRNDFEPMHEQLKPKIEIKLAPVGGRSSNTTSLPLFNTEAVGEGGVIVAIGWSGQWAASFTHEGDGIRICAGMELTRLRLYNGEQIRTPRILLLFWRGDDFLVGQNLFRQLILAHYSPKQNGQPVTLPLSCTSCGPPDEANQATEQNQIEFASEFVCYGVEYFWLDAGWFEGRWPNGVGNWFPRKDGFPSGLRPLSDALNRMGFKGLILWFEPERVFQGSWIDREHPDWVLRLPNNPNGLLNLGNEDARKWLTEHISTMIEREGISIYRQDFNIDPLPFWRAADPPDRQGITEIRHIEGLYEFWDELLRRHPNLIIDNCASGGRRIDLETVSRSVVLWRSDYYYFEPIGQQCHTYGISLWLPTTATGSGFPMAYSLRSAMNNGVGLWVPWSPKASHEIYSRYVPWANWEAGETIDVEFAKALVDEFKRVRHFFFGDFYPLTPYSTDDDVWMAYQFHRTDLNAGIALAFRRGKCQQSSLRLKLRGLLGSAIYEVEISDEQLMRKTFTLTGK
ncbi:MAG: alpha-galactosidase, partial [Armatimonadota bacterium]|nr:alpha-galactosidase [Armatimonadota bacterium]